MDAAKKKELVDGFVETAFEDMHMYQKQMLKDMLNGIAYYPVSSRRKIGFMNHEETSNDR